MKKLMKVVSAVVIAGALFTSCTKDNTAPTISSATIDPTSDVKPGDKVNIAAVLSDSEAEMDNATLTYVYNGSAATTVETVDLTTSGGSYNYSHEFEVPAGAKTGDTYTFTLALTDVHKKDPQTVTEVFATVTVKAGADIDTYEAKLLGSKSSSTGSYFATTTGTVYSSSQANSNQDKVDFIYFYEEDGTSPDAATIASPSDAVITDGAADVDMAGLSGTAWTTKNETKFKTSSVSAADFDAMDTDADFADVTGISSTKMTGLAVDDVFYFETEAGKKGLVKVKAINTGIAGDITIDVKVQK